MSLIRETQERTNPKNQVEIDVPKIGSTERLPEPPDVPDPLNQPSILPEAPTAPVTPYDVPDNVSDEQVSEAARSLTQYQQQQQQDFLDQTRYNPPNIFDIDVSHYESLADAKLKGGVQPTYYEQLVTRVKQNAELNQQRTELNEDTRFTEESVHNGNYGAVNPKKQTAGITRMQDRSFGTVPNLDGIQPMGGRITLPGFVNSILSNPNVGGNPGGARIFETYINEVFADLEQRFNLSEGVIGMDTSAIDNRAWGYREFPDGTVFNPFGNLALLKHAATNNPKAFFSSFIPTTKNPLGVFGTVMMGSEWGDYPDGFIGALMYAFDFSRYFVAAGMDLYTTAQGESTGRWEDSRTMQALWGRDFSIASAQRVNPETGEVENPLSLWAQQKAEPKTWREWSERNWLAKNIIVPIDKAKKVITGRSGLDDELSVPADLIGLQEFATGLVLDGFISAGATRAVEEVSVLQKNAQTAKAGVTPNDSLADLQLKSQAKEKAINKLRRKKFDRGTLTVDEQLKLDDLIDQQQTILGYEKQFDTFGEIRVTDGTEAAYLQALDETEQLLQEIEKQASLLGDEAGNITIGSTIQRGQAGLDIKARQTLGAPQHEVGPATVADLQPVTPRYQVKTDYEFKAAQFEAMETLSNGERAARVPSVYDESTGTVRAQSAVDDSPNVPDPPVIKGPDRGTELSNNLAVAKERVNWEPGNPEFQQGARQAQIDYDQYLFDTSPEAFQIAEESAQRAYDAASSRLADLREFERSGRVFPANRTRFQVDVEDATIEFVLARNRLEDLETIKAGANRPRTFLENLQDEAHELRILRGTTPGDRNVLNNLLEVERTLDEQMFTQFPESFQGRKIAAQARVAALRQRAAANSRRLQELQTNPASSVDDVQQRIAFDEYYQRELEYAQIRADDLRALSQETEIVDPRLSAIEEFSQRVEAQVLGGDLEGVARTVDEVLEGAVVDAEAARVVDELEAAPRDVEVVGGEAAPVTRAEDVGPTDIQVEAARPDADVFEARRQQQLAAEPEVPVEQKTLNLFDTEYTVTRHPLAEGELTTMPISELRKAQNAITQAGENEIPGRINRFLEFLNENQDFQAPEIVIRQDGTILFKDGRHRTEALAQLGVDEIPVVVQREGVTSVAEPELPSPPKAEPLEPTIATAVDITPEATVSTRAVNNAVDEVVVPQVDELVEPQNLQQAVDDINEFEQSLLSTRQRLEELGATPEELAKVDAGLERINLTKQYVNSIYDPGAAKRLADRLKKVELKNLDAQINTAQRTLEDRQAAISRGQTRTERKELRATAAEAQENLEALQKQRADLDNIRKQLGQADRLAEEVSLRRQFEFLENHPRLQGQQEKAFLKPFRDKIQNARTKTARLKAQKEFVEAANEAFATRILTNNPEFIAAKNTLREQIRTSPNAKVKKQFETRLRALEAEFKPLKFRGLSTLDNIIKEVTELQKELTNRTTSDARKAVLQARIGRLEQLSDELAGVPARPPSPAVGVRNLRKIKDLRSTLTRLLRQADDPQKVAALREQLQKVINAEQRVTPRAEPLEPTIAAADDIAVDVAAARGRADIENIRDEIQTRIDDANQNIAKAQQNINDAEAARLDVVGEEGTEQALDALIRESQDAIELNQELIQRQQNNLSEVNRILEGPERVEPLQPTSAIADDITAAKQDFVNSTNQVDQANAAARVQRLEAEQAAANSRINDVRNRGTTRENYPKNISIPEAPNDFRFPDSSFNSTPPPKQRYVPHISKDGKVVNRSPLSEWGNNFEKAGKQMVRVGEITTHPDLIPLGKLDDISSENLGLLYQRVANQNADLLAIYKQEVVQVNKLAEQYPVGMNQAKSQTMAGGVPEQVSISVPNSKLGNFEKADGVPLASVKPVVEETYYMGTRLTNTADTFADPASVAGRSPLGTVHTLTQDAFYAEDIAKSPVQNVPNSTSRAYNARTGTVLEVQVNADRVLNGSAKLPTGFKNELYNGLSDINSPQLKTIVGSNGGIEELARGFEDAIDKATNYKDLISRIDDALEDWSVTRGFAEFDELASLQAQRAVTRSLQASGIQAIEVTTRVKNKISKQLGVVDPTIIRATNFQQMDTGSVLEQVARQANAEVWQNRFYNKKKTKSKFAKANAEKSKMQLAAQRVHETEKKLQQAHKNHADLATEMAKRENISEAEKLQRMLERDAAIDKVFQGKNDKGIQTSLSTSLPETFKRAPKSEYLNDDYGEILSPDKSLRETKDLTEVWDKIPDSVNGVKASPDIKARMQRLRQQKRAAMSKQHQREAAEAMQEQAVRTEVETTRQMYMGDKVNLRDTSLNPVQQWLAARFDMQWKMLQPLKRSGAGLIRKHLGLTAKIGNGLIETQVRMVMVNEAIRHNKLVKQILGKKGAGLTGKTLRKINIDILEIGAHHKLNGGHELLPAGLNVQKQRYDFLVDELKGFGVSDDDIFDLFESAISMSNKADEARVIANALGQNIGSVNQIGYFSRILDRDVAHWLKKLEDEGKPVRNKIVNPTAMDMDITTARNTFHHVPEDLNVMSWMMGITRDELDRIIMNDEFAAALQKIDAANPGVIDNWVDSGILSKIPYTTNEVSELIIKKYGKDLPMFLRGDIFLDNPVKAWNMYGDFLKKQVERSAIYKDLVEDGLDAGWSVPKTVYDELPDELAPGVQGISKKDFVLWNEGSVRQFLPNYKGADIYVHKAVNNQVQSMVHLFGHPELMNTSSQIVSEISRFYNQSLLLHPFYSINVAVDSTMQFFAAGGDLLRLPQAYWDLGKALRTGNLDHFDNVTKAYWNWDGTKQLTKREFFEEFMLTNSIDITPFDLPGLGDEIGATGKKWSSLVNPRRGMNWAWNYTRRFGAQNASTQFFRDIADVQGKFFQPLAAAASHAEAASKWALAQTWLDARPGNSIGQFLRDYGGQYPTRKIQSGKEAWDWMQDYYTTWNTAGAGAFGAATGFITPFSTYAYWNTPANIRKFMKNPQQYINYARIWGFLNRDMSIDDKINEYSVPSWLADNMSFALGKDSQGNWIMFRPRGMFSQGDIASAITLTGKTSARMMGFYPGTAQDQVNQILAEESDTRIFADLIEGFAPIYGKLGSLYTGEDIQGRPIANPNQVEGRLTGLNWRTEYLLSLYEPLGRLIRANPFNVLGQPEIIDQRTKVPIKAAVPGKIFGNERIEYDTTKYENPAGILKVLQYLGAPITIIDADRNLTWSLSRLGTTYNKVSQVRSTMHKEMVEMTQKGTDKTFPAKFAKLKRRHDDLMMKEIQLAKDFTILKEYFKANNIVSSQDIRTVETAIYNEWLRQNPNVYEKILDRFRANEREIIDAFESTIETDTTDIDLGVGGTELDASTND